MTRSSRWRTVLQLAGGTSLGQIAVVTSSPLLTRIYSPDSFGSGAVFASLLAIFTVVSCLGVEQFVPTAKSSDLIEVASASSWSIIAVSLCSGIAGLLILDSMALALVLWLAVFLSGRFALASQFAIRYGDFSSLARRNAAQGAVQAFSQLGLGLVSPSALSLASGLALSRATSWWMTRRLLKPFVLGLPRRSLTQRFTVETSSAALSILGATVALQIPVSTGSLVFGSAAAGQIALSQRVMSLPLAIIGAAIGQVLLHDLAELTDSGARYQKIRSATIRLATAGALLSIATAFTAQYAFNFIFGNEWLIAGKIAAISSVAVGTQMISSPLSTILAPFGASRKFLLLILVRIAIGATVFVLASVFGFSLQIAIALYMFLTALQNCVLIRLAFAVVKRP